MIQPRSLITGSLALTAPGPVRSRVMRPIQSQLGIISECLDVRTSQDTSAVQYVARVAADAC